MLAIERGLRRWAASILSIFERVEPHAQVIHLDWIRAGIHGRIRERRVRKGIRRWCGALCKRKCLNVEAPFEVLEGVAFGIGLYIPLIPGEAEWRFGYLDD